ncbi:MAG: protoglobin domain-containing protein [Gallionella sp.]|nr:protoglobin domain-containing protein [Gallionella sp.]
MKFSQSLTQLMGIDANEQASRKKFVDFGDQDIQALKALRPFIQQHSDVIVDAFYANIERYTELMNVIGEAGSNIDRLKTTQKRYLLEMFDGDYGDAYFERRLKIGVIHNKIGLTPRWYLGSYSVYSCQIVKLIQRQYRWNARAREAALQALHKIISIDSQLSMDTYIHGLMTDLNGVSMSKDEIEARLATYQTFIASVAEGDLSHRLDVVGSDDLAKLGSNLNGMTESLAHVASDTTEAINTIYSTLEQLQQSINGQSAGASEQAAAVNETTSSLDEIKAMSAQTMEKMQVLGESAERARRESEQGSVAVEQAILGMIAIRERVEGIAQTILALSEQTQQIGEITAVVTNLAQQSKMLALNASIEAAKAGEAGKGFAVVAAEVRELAEQSQQSTAQVQKILQDIRHATDRAVMATEEGSKGVDAGMLSVQKSGEVVRKLGEVVRETAIASQQISAVVRQKFIGIEQVTLAMKEINKVTAQFVTTAQQSKQSSADLRRVAERLRDSVSTYKL